MAQITTATNKILKLKKRIRAVSGGTGASKTYSILMVLIDYAQCHKDSIDVISESFPHLKAGVIKDFKEIMLDRGYWKDDLWNKQDHAYSFETGSVLKFTSMDKLGKAHGPRRDVLFINEANYLPYNIADQLITRTRKHVWLDWNPSTEFWYYTEMEGKRDDIDFLRLTYLDNEALSDMEVKEIESHKHNKSWWKVYGLGELGEIEGLIYKGWKVVDDIPVEARVERRWLDFGYTNDPSACGTINVCNGAWYFNEEFYLKGLSNKQIADRLLAMDKPQTLIIADSAEPKSIDEIAAYGLNIVGSQKGKDSVTSGIQLVQDQPIFVTRRSNNILREQRNYLWLVDKNGKVLNTPDPTCEDHHMDGIRYALSTLGRLKQEVSHWDRVFEDELSNQPLKKQFNKGR